MENNDVEPDEAGPPGNNPSEPERPDPEQVRANAAFRAELGGLIDAAAVANRKLATAAAEQAVAVEAARVFSARSDRGVSATTADMVRRSLWRRSPV